MSDPIHSQPGQAFARAMRAIGLGSEVFWFESRPAEPADVLAGRVKLAAKLLGRAFGLGHSQALELLAQALRFAHWHQLSAHLGRAKGLADGSAPESWLDGLAAAVVLMPAPDDELALHPGHLQALERLAGTLAMLGDLPPQRVLDEVLARLYAGGRWADVVQRHPLKAAKPLYGFEVHPEDGSGPEPAGGFVTSLACGELIEELDEIWQGYDDFPPARKRQARPWVEAALDAQPGFLEAGLALAWMLLDARDALASGTVARYVKAAEALIPKGFKGTLPWAVIDNRFYHRLLWLQMRIASQAGDLTLATQAARKQLRLNPRDNLGVRQVLPCLQLRQGQVVGARRALAHLQGEIGLGASLVRSFVHFAAGERLQYRREMALALFTLPVLRTLLAGALADDDDGFRQVHADLETLEEFAVPAYRAVTGLRAATLKFLADPAVIDAERRLLRCWQACRAADGHDGAVLGTRLQPWYEMVSDLADAVSG